MTNRRFLLSCALGLAMLLAACGGAAADPASEAPTEASGAEEPATTEAPATSEPEPSGGSGLCAHAYFPVVEGATWTYTGNGLSGPYTYSSTVSNVRADGFTLTHAFEDLTASQEWSCTTDGIAALDYGSGPDATVNSAGITSVFETTSSTGMTMPKELALGETWSQTFEIAGDMTVADQSLSATGTITQTYTAVREESITLPTGTYTALVVEGTTAMDLQANMQGMSVPMTLESATTSWWVLGIGLVKSTNLVSVEGAESFEAISTLESYSIP